MAVSNDLYLALLSLDSYSRGYGAGIADLGGVGAQIGNALLSTDSTLEIGLTSTSLTGFYASAYTLNGQTNISYRDTDTPT